MDRVAKGSCSERFELRLTPAHVQMIGWLKARLNRSGNSLIREALRRMYEAEQEAMLRQVTGTPHEWRR